MGGAVGGLAPPKPLLRGVGGGLQGGVGERLTIRQAGFPIWTPGEEQIAHSHEERPQFEKNEMLHGHGVGA